ncbi:MAG: NAD(P)/FAD-dependent oxidoreductase [Deltaproteobacteria bacterium]|nr:MAG: NAD(P)/FAD-dependent oxidoreductase [Deltaproteobacteria bacterium]
MTNEHFDALVVGAGISGIGAGYHLRTTCPGRTYAILEARDDIGGTWDLFRYPGIRSDSDMYTLGYSFKPWKGPKAIADGWSILEYLRQTVNEHGIARQIRFGHRVKRASWSSEQARWTVEVERGERNEVVHFTCNFLFMCSGYYDYAQGYAPDFPGTERFAGRIVHPQKWPEAFDYAGKRVVVIGSGATAVTLVPAMATTAAHVAMLQRSPTYIISLPGEDPIANWLRRRLPARVAYGITRWKNVLLALWFYRFCRRHPTRARALVTKWLRNDLGPDYDVGTHFNPRYNPWEQRLCLVPDSDLFKTMREGRASVVTDQIETFTEKGLKLRSGAELEADVIVTATGLNLRFLGGLEATLDGVRVDFAKTFNYKGMMFSDVPNLALAIGYTNASWTLKAELICRYVCRLLNHMAKTGTRQCTPRLRDPDLEPSPFLDLTSGYVQRAIHMFPKQGSKMPWKLHQNYALDLMMLRYGKVDDGVMEFSNPAVPVACQEEATGLVAAG